MTPDEFRYAAMARGEKVPKPFALRWALPYFVGDEPRHWRWVQWTSLACLCWLTSVWTGIWWTGLLPLGLSGVTFNLKHPMLVDLPALTFALGAAVAWDHNMWWLALTLAVIGSSVKETAAPFAAVYAWNPLLLVGLVPVAIRAVMRSGPDPIPSGPAHDALVSPVRVSWEHHRALPLWVYVLPWGVLLAALVNPSPQLWVTLALAYGQLVLATDAVRLYVWAFPVMALCAAPLFAPWVLLAVVLHLTNPWKTQGV